MVCINQTLVDKTKYGNRKLTMDYYIESGLNVSVDTDESLFLLATCYYRSGRVAQAYNILKDKGPVSPQCKYLWARCCLDLQK